MTKAKGKAKADAKPVVIERRRLPDERKSRTHKFEIRTQRNDERGIPQPITVKGYLTVGFYDDGGVGEIFVKLDQQGSEVSGFVDAWATSVSLLLQLGMPLSDIVRKFRGSRFEPSGMTGDPDIPIAKSPVDYICRILEARYLTEAS